VLTVVNTTLQVLVTGVHFAALSVKQSSLRSWNKPTENLFLRPPERSEGGLGKGDVETEAKRKDFG
jgi:hypothetical protein